MLTYKKIKFLVPVSLLILVILIVNFFITRDLKNKENELASLKKERTVLIEEKLALTNQLISLQEKEKNKIAAPQEKKIVLKPTVKKEELKPKVIKAYVTAFNTVKSQTDNDPCNAKFGYICGRDDVVACPRSIPAHTKVIILGKKYECMDWTSTKYPLRFDISFDKNISKAIQFGKKYLSITILYE